jgi:hypothetical protein
VASTKRVHGLTIVASVALHAAMAGLLSWMALRSMSSDGTRAPPGRALPYGQAGSDVSVDLPSVGEGTWIERQLTTMEAAGAPPRVTGWDAVAHLDTGSP